MTNEQVITTRPGQRIGNKISFGKGIVGNVGDYLRFNALGGFMGILTTRSNGLGRDYRIQADGSLVRSVF